jgi:hypothetical protein
MFNFMRCRCSKSIGALFAMCFYCLSHPLIAYAGEISVANEGQLLKSLEVATKGDIITVLSGVYILR